MFKKLGVTMIIRLNKPQYDGKVFEQAGIRVVELYFPDGSTPSPDIVMTFLQLVENNKGAVAVHCKAGLGRTGTLVGIYLMKHFRFCAPDIIAWLRILRPGSVLGPQQYYLVEAQPAVFAMTPGSPIWQGLQKEYKEFAFKMESTVEAIENAMTTEEALIAQYGQHGQGDILMSKKKLDKV